MMKRNLRPKPWWLLSTGLGLIALFSGCDEDSHSHSGAWYQFDEGATTRWSSPENAKGLPGEAGRENHGAKGHAFDPIPAGASVTLLDTKGPGMVNRMWITVIDRSPEMLRSLRIDMYWDDEESPAVSAPLGDFFGMGLGHITSFHNALFANAEGRSFVSFIPMPFKTSARIVVTNESDQLLTHIFYDVNYTLTDNWDDDNLYFHAYWHRDTATELARDFELLPAISGRGRYLGANVGVVTRPAYGDSWWGEGEVKVFLDADSSFPSLAGTGTEDYIGTGWGQGVFFNDYAGCLLASDSLREWCFYRYHIPDPVWFGSRCRVTLQQIGGQMKDFVARLQQQGVPLIPVTVDASGGGGPMMKLYSPDSVTQVSASGIPNGWVNFYRSDDVSAVAYFYLDKPSHGLPPLQNRSIRIFNLK